MRTDRNSPSGRHWADVLAIVTGVALIGYAIWPGGPKASTHAGDEMSVTDVRFAIWVATGFAALVAVVLAQRWRQRDAARGLLAVSGLVLLGTIAFLDEFSAVSVLPLALPGVALLLASFGAGPMPRYVDHDHEAGDVPPPDTRGRAIVSDREIVRETPRGVPGDVVLARSRDADLRASRSISDEERRRRVEEHELNGPLGP